ncbi:DHH phosphoesterase [Panus rudis PR-1116 ss-1]|nr:DHH phosphoesterase [Panus rudis PR-1116 ss-1]
MSNKAPSSVLADFLKAQKEQYLKAIEEGKGKEWLVVMGNEAGDLDSLASAVAYAWYAATIQQIPAVPLIQTPRPDLHLRSENLYALELAGIPPADPPLLCISDIPSVTPFPSNKFALVDHNRLGSRFTEENPDAKVVAVIDHHEDEGLYKDTADPRVITVPTGSASSLVALHLGEKCADQVPPELATLILSAILIDTHGLKVGGKAEDADRHAASFLAPHSLLSIEAGVAESELHSQPAIQEMAKTLDEEKSSVAHLNTTDLLRRDYKEYTMTPHWQKDKPILIGLASVPVGLKLWTKRDQAFFTSTEQFMNERKLTVLGVLTSFRDEEKLNKHGKPKHRREQLFVVRKGEVKGLAKILFKGLEASKELKLKKMDLKNKSKFSFKKHKDFSKEFKARMWKQKNVDATRKVTAPVVKGVIEGTQEKA